MGLGSSQWRVFARKEEVKNRLPVLLASFVVTFLFVYRPSMSATPGGEITEAEAAIRKADADWAAAASTASVDAWMGYYAADAIVMAPNVQIASTPERVRQTVTNLLALPALSVAWHPIKVEVATSGDLGYLIGAYELRYDDARGAHVSDQGKLLEIWKKQSDGSWKCIVDTWNSDGLAAAAQAASPASAHGRLTTAVSVSPPPGANSVTSSQSSAQALSSEYGEMPTQYEEAIRQYFQQYLKDPDSVRYQEITKPEKGSATTVTGTILMRETRLRGWTVKATIDAKNAHGVYVGYRTYTFLFRGEKIIHTASPLGEDEMK
jgi:ketosteroid isomerase-like protein